MENNEDTLIKLTGTRATVWLTRAEWCRQQTTWPIVCDKITRFVTVPNWQWMIWKADMTDDPFRRFGSWAWIKACRRQAAGPNRKEPGLLFTDILMQMMNRFSRRYPYNQTANDNRQASAVGWSRYKGGRPHKGLLCEIFGRHVSKVRNQRRRVVPLSVINS